MFDHPCPVQNEGRDREKELTYRDNSAPSAKKGGMSERARDSRLLALGGQLIGGEQRAKQIVHVGKVVTIVVLVGRVVDQVVPVW